MSRKWALITTIALLVLLVAGAFLHARLGKWYTTVSLPPGSSASTGCGHLPKFEFLHDYDQLNRAGGSFGFEKIGHLCLEQIEPISG
jgi:hypothetical protein